jgi:hypothetical protein
MDNQLEWIKDVLDDTKNNPSIEHVFMFAHEPAFPNGGHLQDAQWYSGGDSAENEDYVGNPLDRAYVVERRDELWEAISQNGKVVAVFFGDEHNYNRSRLSLVEQVRHSMRKKIRRGPETLRSSTHPSTTAWSVWTGTRYH